MNTKSSKPVLHTVITADGVTHSRKSPRHYAVAIVIEYHPVIANNRFAQIARKNAASAIAQAEKYELEAKTAPAVETQIKVPSGYGWDRTETLWTAETLLKWAVDQRGHAANYIKRAIELEAAADNPATKPTFYLEGWSQTEEQGHKTARTTLNKIIKYSGNAHGATVHVIPATRHG